MASRSWNRVELIGNLTRDPELRYTPTGTAVATFSIATNRSFVSDGERREEVDFHRVVAWNKLAELCSQLLKKGNRIFVSGRLQNRSWEGQDGQQRNITEIVIEDMILLTAKGDGPSEYTPPADSTADMPEELPTRSAEDMPGKTDQPVKSEDKKEEVSKEDKKESQKPGKEEVEDLDDLPF